MALKKYKKLSFSECANVFIGKGNETFIYSINFEGWREFTQRENVRAELERFETWLQSVGIPFDDALKEEAERIFEHFAETRSNNGSHRWEVRRENKIVLSGLKGPKDLFHDLVVCRPENWRSFVVKAFDDKEEAIKFFNEEKKTCTTRRVQGNLMPLIEADVIELQDVNYTVDGERFGSTTLKTYFQPLKDD